MAVTIALKRFAWVNIAITVTIMLSYSKTIKHDR